MSKFIRRTHLYLALFLVPWTLVYSLATIAMNHRDFFRERYDGNLQEWATEYERSYESTLVGDAEPVEMAAQILGDLGLGGPYEAVRGRDGNLTIHRTDPVMPRRITYEPESGQLVVERLVFRVPVFLTRLHHRYGYHSEHAVNDLWAASVDFVIFAIAFWVLSGLWMWWEMKATRRWGAVCLFVSFGLFGIFLCSI